MDDQTVTSLVATWLSMPGAMTLRCVLKTWQEALSNKNNDTFWDKVVDGTHGQETAEGLRLGLSGSWLKSSIKQKKGTNLRSSSQSQRTLPALSKCLESNLPRGRKSGVKPISCRFSWITSGTLRITI